MQRMLAAQLAQDLQRSIAAALAGELARARHLASQAQILRRCRLVDPRRRRHWHGRRRPDAARTRSREIVARLPEVVDGSERLWQQAAADLRTRVVVAEEQHAAR